MTEAEPAETAAPASRPETRRFYTGGWQLWAIWLLAALGLVQGVTRLRSGSVIETVLGVTWLLLVPALVWTARQRARTPQVRLTADTLWTLRRSQPLVSLAELEGVAWSRRGALAFRRNAGEPWILPLSALSAADRLRLRRLLDERLPFDVPQR